MHRLKRPHLESFWPYETFLVKNFLGLFRSHGFMVLSSLWGPYRAPPTGPPLWGPLWGPEGTGQQAPPAGSSAGSVGSAVRRLLRLSFSTAFVDFGLDFGILVRFGLDLASGLHSLGVWSDLIRFRLDFGWISARFGLDFALPLAFLRIFAFSSFL